MKRLQYSFVTLLRRIQISRNTLFVFIEGYTDRYVYSILIDSVCKGKIAYDVITSYELDGSGGGKDNLLNFFNFLKRNNRLMHLFKNKYNISCFFLDKDVDDLIGKKINSKHLVYTRNFQLENYLYSYGDINKASALAASLDIGSVQRYLKKHPDWRKRAAICWKEWIILCIFSLLYNVRPTCNYGEHKSPINNGVYGPIDKLKYKSYLTKLKSLSHCSNNEFQKKMKAVTYLVDKMYARDEFDSLFKGKWYSNFLIEDIRKIAGSRQCSLNGLEERLLSNLSSTLNFNKEWTEDFKRPLSCLLNEYQNTRRLPS